MPMTFSNEDEKKVEGVGYGGPRDPRLDQGATVAPGIYPTSFLKNERCQRIISMLQLLSMSLISQLQHLVHLLVSSISQYQRHVQ